MNKQRYFHIRNVDLYEPGVIKADGILPHGGITFLVKHVGENTVAVSHSECSLKDNFCRRTGRSFADAKPFTVIALDRLPETMRTIVEKSKRITCPSVLDFDFTTKYFKE